MTAFIRIFSKGHLTRGSKAETETLISENECYQIPRLEEFREKLDQKDRKFYVPFAYNITKEVIMCFRQHPTTVENLSNIRSNDSIREDLVLLTFAIYLGLQELAELFADLICEKIRGMAPEVIRKTTRALYDLPRVYKTNVEFWDKIVENYCNCHAVDTFSTEIEYFMGHFQLIPNESEHVNHVYPDRAFVPQSETDQKLETCPYGQHVPLLAGDGAEDSHKKARLLLLSRMTPSEVICRQRVNKDWYSSACSLFETKVKTLFIFASHNTSLINKYASFQSSAKLDQISEYKYEGNKHSTPSFELVIKNVFDIPLQGGFLRVFKSVEHVVYFTRFQTACEWKVGLDHIIDAFGHLKTLILHDLDNLPLQYLSGLSKIRTIHIANVLKEEILFLANSQDFQLVNYSNRNEDEAEPNYNQRTPGKCTVFVHNTDVTRTRRRHH